MGPGDLTEILQGLLPEKHPDLLIGAELWADAAVFRLTEDIALVQTLDFFTPIVDDPYDFGRIAAANSLSDIYAMGGRPVTAMNIVCFPVREMDKDILRRILDGGLDRIHAAGAVLAGGHSVEDSEMKYGLSVTGIVRPDTFVTNAGALAGDFLVLTKPLGTGILSTALKAGKIGSDSVRTITDIMAELNRDASEVMMETGVNACTDISGFGLIGHALEMARASSVGIRIFSGKVPVIPEALHFASRGLLPEGSYANLTFCSPSIMTEPDVPPLLIDILTDAQTSGGLLIAVSKERVEILVDGLRKRNTPSADIIGVVTDEPKGKIILQR